MDIPSIAREGGGNLWRTVIQLCLTSTEIPNRYSSSSTPVDKRLASFHGGKNRFSWLVFCDQVM